MWRNRSFYETDTGWHSHHLLEFMIRSGIGCFYEAYKKGILTPGVQLLSNSLSNCCCMTKVIPLEDDVS